MEAQKELLKALIEAEKHLDWIGYGDKYERECAMEQNLPARLECTIEKYSHILEN